MTKTQNIDVILGQIPWISGFGPVDDSMCPGGWYEALAESDKFGWRLSLLARDSIVEDPDGDSRITARTHEQEFPIADFENKPSFDIRDIKTPDHIDSTFNKTFKKYFGSFEKIKKHSADFMFEKAKVLIKQHKEEDAFEIIKNVGLSIYYDSMYQIYNDKAHAHFAGVDFEHFMASDYAAIKNDPNVTAKDIINFMSEYDFGNGKNFSRDEILHKIEDVESLLSGITPTIDKYRITGEKNTARYTPEREELHVKILEEKIKIKIQQLKLGTKFGVRTC